MPEGRVVQCVGGFQTVLTPEAKTIVCTARGRIKKSQGEIVTGDLVLYENGPEAAVIEAVLPRRNILRRPVVANVDQAVLVFALRDPMPNDLLIDRFLVSIMAAGLPVLLCFNKADLVGAKEAEALAGRYREIGFRVVLTSTVARKGRHKLLAELYGLTTVFCGPSGVGKSALLNMVKPGLTLTTGEVSAKIKRGRHTTRTARLIPIGRQGYVVDTPGYTQVDLAGVDSQRLLGCFPELASRTGACRFDGCLHLAEPGCSVKEAVARGVLPPERYEHYRLFMAEIAENTDRSRHR
ncbi:MAG: ribosome small subunit-dependent GTPase A [Bacteroidota bacterium]